MPRRLIAVMAAGALGIAPGAALAKRHHHPKHHRSAVAKVYRDCARHSHLHGHYSVKVLKRAKRHMPKDVRNYTSCPRQINRALRSAEGHGKKHRHKAHQRR
jgi:hypothetical protein